MNTVTRGLAATALAIAGWMAPVVPDARAMPTGASGHCPDCSEQVTVAIERLGQAPFTGEFFQPFEIGFFGPGNMHYQNFMQRMRDVLVSEARTREVFGPPLATVLFGRGWRPRGRVDGPWQAHLCNGDGDCVVAAIDPDRTPAYLGAVDRFGNRILNELVDPGTLAFPPGQGDHVRRLADRLREHRVVVTDDSDGIGWTYVDCSYANGRLQSCRFHSVSPPGIAAP